MSVWREALLGLYCYGSAPLRRRAMAARSAAGTAPMMVLFYHRVADDDASPWTISNALFSRQMRWLKQNFEMLSLAEGQARIAARVNRRPAVCVTFDDGYASNCDQALPLLVREGIPCTYFVSSQLAIEGRPFPHDLARGRPLAPNTPEQLRELAAQGIEIGSHTRTHADVAKIDNRERLDDELAVSRQELEELTGRPVRYFAFPYGQHRNMSCEAFHLARETGYEGVVSAYGGYNLPGDDPFHLQRFHGDASMVRLKNWATFDPRKLRLTERFEYRLGPVETAAEPVGAIG